MEQTLRAIKPLHAAKAQHCEMKIFIDKDPNAVEGSVNKWLKENRVSIQHFGQSQSERNGNFVFIITVLYTPAEAI
ncbi:MAG: hypothetical protein ACM3VS_18435 [Candidatus Dadabacteria bacterium]